MDSLPRFFAKRYGYAILTILPVLGGCVAIGALSNILAARGASQETQDGVAILGMFVLIIALSVVILVRKPLPGPLGAWQRLWNKIPTWKGRIAERQHRS